MSPSKCTVIVPCYNEAERLDRHAFIDFAQQHGNEVRLLLVNDGSKDKTMAVLSELKTAYPERIDVLDLGSNRGKAEAVRAGLLAAMDRGALAVGYLDADLATPFSELLRLFELLENRHLDIAIASRVALLGLDIQRNPTRHYMGRLFATLASTVLRLRVYDTQCGAKLFRATPSLASALSRPFISRWGFDIELLGRLIIGAPGVPPVPSHKIAEMPLGVWTDVPGSKISPAAMLNTVRQLGRIEMDLRRRRSAVGGSGSKPDQGA